MGNRTSDMLNQLKQHRAERRKPKRFVALKKIPLDSRHQREVSFDQVDRQKHSITQRHHLLNSTALLVEIGFHVIFGILISVSFIVDRIESEKDMFDADLITEETKTKRRFIPREVRKFDNAKQEQRKVVINRPITTASAQLPSNGDFVIPQDPETTVDLTASVANEGPALIKVERGFVQPATTIEPEIKAPTFEIQREAPTLIDKLATPTPDAAPSLDNINLGSTSQVVNAAYKIKVEPKYPETAKKAEKEGAVILQATIDENGIPQNVIALTGLGFGLEAAAIAAFKKSTFRPAMKAGKAISQLIEIKFEFKLEDG